MALVKPASLLSRRLLVQFPWSACQSVTKLGIYVTPAKKILNSFIHFDCAIIKESAFGLTTHIYFVAHSKYIIISTRSLNCAESSRPCPLTVFFCKMSQTYFFDLLPGDFTDLHQTSHTASVDSPDKKLLK